MSKKPHPPRPPKVTKQISLLVPFRSDDAYRMRVWAFMEQYWRSHLKDVEIVIGHDPLSDSGFLPFSKSVAVNDERSPTHTGDVVKIQAVWGSPVGAARPG